MYVNGLPLFENMSKVYHHTVVAEKHTSDFRTRRSTACPYTWPMALNLNKSQPSGSINMSRVDTAKIVLTKPELGCRNSTLQRLYAVNLNILRVKMASPVSHMETKLTQAL